MKPNCLIIYILFRVESSCLLINDADQAKNPNPTYHRQEPCRRPTLFTSQKKDGRSFKANYYNEFNWVKLRLSKMVRYFAAIVGIFQIICITRKITLSWMESMTVKYQYLSTDVFIPIRYYVLFYFHFQTYTSRTWVYLLQIQNIRSYSTYLPVCTKLWWL